MSADLGQRYRILKRNGMWRLDVYDCDSLVGRPLFRKSYWFDTWDDAVFDVRRRQYQRKLNETLDRMLAW